MPAAPPTAPQALAAGAEASPAPSALSMRWNADALAQALAPLWPGLRVEVAASLGSTNTVLVERARQAADAQPCLLVAEVQTQGRGRQGKVWHAAPGASLTFSLALPLAPADWNGLSLAVGLAVAEALDPLSTPTQRPRLWLKWPNDLLLEDADGRRRKLGGILIETVPCQGRRMAVLGIGLNLRPQALPAQPSESLPWGVADLQVLWPGVDAPQVLQRLALPLAQALRAFEALGFAPLAEAYTRRDALRGQAVAAQLAQAPDGLAEGVAEGVDAQGLLWLRWGTQRLRLHSGEVSLRQSAAAAPTQTGAVGPSPAAAWGPGRAPADGTPPC